MQFQSSFHLSFAVLVCYRSPILYLALGEVYLPLSAAFPYYTTLRNLSYHLDSSKDGTFTLYGVLFQRTYDES